MKKQPTIAEMQKQVKLLEEANSLLIHELSKAEITIRDYKYDLQLSIARIDKLIDTNLNYSSK